MENEYREIVRKFNEIYGPLKKKYNLRHHIHFGQYKDGIIEIWEYVGEKKRKCIVRAKEKEDVDCYKKAITALEHYRREREKSEHEKNAAMAV